VPAAGAPDNRRELSRRVRIRLVGVPPTIRGILADAASRKPIDLIETDPPFAGTRRQPAAAEVVLAVTPDPNDCATASALLLRSGAARVGLLTPAGRHLVIYDLARRPVVVADLPASELLDLLCRDVGPL